jgi:hypothetical protein
VGGKVGNFVGQSFSKNYSLLRYEKKTVVSLNVSSSIHWIRSMLHQTELPSRYIQTTTTSPLKINGYKLTLKNDGVSQMRKRSASIQSQFCLKKLGMRSQRARLPAVLPWANCGG